MPTRPTRARRLLLWERVDTWGSEVAAVELEADGIRATGTQLGVDPLPYRLDYELDASEGFVTRLLSVRATGEGWARGVELRRGDDREWRCDASERGDADLPSPGGEAGGLTDALDCDLGLSPLTNLMPIRRHRLHEAHGEVDLLAAWVSAPDLALHSYPQRYEHVARGDGGATVQFVDRGLAAGFEAELQLDADGLVREYPELARRVGPG